MTVMWHQDRMKMRIEVFLKSVLRERLPPEAKGQMTLDMADGSTLEDLVRKLEFRHRVILTLNGRLEELQELLYAENKHKVLIVLQAMDTGGKDGTIRHVFEGVNPQGVKVANFKVPPREELDHDYLWRVHKQAPGKGQITIFNRSHYEDHARQLKLSPG